MALKNTKKNVRPMDTTKIVVAMARDLSHIDFTWREGPFML